MDRTWPSLPVDESDDRLATSRHFERRTGRGTVVPNVVSLSEIRISLKRKGRDFDFIIVDGSAGSRIRKERYWLGHWRNGQGELENEVIAAL